MNYLRQNMVLYWVVNFFYVLVSPSKWMSGHSVSLRWDRKLNKMMDSHVAVSDVTEYTAKVGGETIWIANYPSHFGRTYPYGPEVLPLNLTRTRLAEYIIENRQTKE